MSATMAGLDAMGQWLQARLFFTNFRPVPLTEHAVFAGTIYRKVWPPLRNMQAVTRRHVCFRSHCPLTRF